MKFLGIGLGRALRLCLLPFRIVALWLAAVVRQRESGLRRGGRLHAPWRL